MQTLVLATSNPGKTAEIVTVLGFYLDVGRLRLLNSSDFGIGSDEIEENGSTFEENAIIKAVETARRTGYVAIADDSGLCVDALGGEPGIMSARWAGTEASDQDRVALLLYRLKDVEPDRRTAQFVCAAAAADPQGVVHVVRGVCEGEIAVAPRGTGGFGYDPIFRIPSLARTMAELAPYEKNRVSHRAIALGLAAPHLRNLLSPPVV